MNRFQKIAWFNLKVLAIGASLGLLIIAVSLVIGELVITYAGFLILLVTSLITDLPRLLLSEPDRETFDEREKQIARKASALSFFAFMILIGCSTLIFFYIGRIPAYPLAAVLIAGLFVAQLTKSSAILIQVSILLRG